MSAELKGYRLLGPDRAAALERLYLLAEVQGVHELAGEIRVWIRSPLPALHLPRVVVRELAGEERAWTGLEGDRPILVTERLMVRPPWVPPPAGYSGRQLVVPRGSAFGSGEHGSTKAALIALEESWPEVLASFADIGTGSGILAAYAALRGCRRILACDTDAAAVRAARELLPEAVVVQGGPEALPAPADGVAANLGADELHCALAGVLHCWTGRAFLVLAGLRPAEVGRLVGRLSRPPDARYSSEDYSALVWRGGGDLLCR